MRIGRADGETVLQLLLVVKVPLQVVRRLNC